MVTRQPIVSVLGHVDHGKTSLLDKIRGSTVAAREAGAITQHIGATEVPLDAIRRLCGPLMAGRDFKVPGLLFIDTPGHRAFTTLRARGGALADLAIVVVDVMEGLMPQTREALGILKQNKTPFVIAANKIDRVLNWEARPNTPFLTSFDEQNAEVQERLEERLFKLIGLLYEAGYPSDRYDRVKDFTKNVALVPLSARTGEGVPDLLLVLTGLAQRFLEAQLTADLEAPGRATVLEVKEERGLGLTLDVILYDGRLREGDTIVVGTAHEPLVTTIRALLKPKAMDEIRDPRDRFDSAREVHAAAGLKINAPQLEGAVAGAPLRAATDDTLDEVVGQVRDESKPTFQLQDEGILVKADTLGGLEALIFELSERDVPVKSAGVGPISRRDVTEAATKPEAKHRVIVAFNVKPLPDAAEAMDTSAAKVITADVIYHLLDAYEAWAKETAKAAEVSARESVTFPGKLLFLPDHTFRVSKPAIIGVRVLGGRIRVGQRVLRTSDGQRLGTIKSIRSGEASQAEAKQGDEVAIAIDGITIGRQLHERDVLLVEIPEMHFRQLKDLQLTDDEREVADELAALRRKEERFWGL